MKVNFSCTQIWGKGVCSGQKNPEDQKYEAGLAQIEHVWSGWDLGEGRGPVKAGRV